jgi:type IV secretion system protein VirB4
MHDGDGVVRVKPNGYLVGYEFRGPDLLGSSWAELRHHADAIAQVIGSLDSRWTVHFELHHRRGGMYPASGHWPDRAVYVLDKARKTSYEDAGDHFFSSTRVWFAWYPLSGRRRVMDWVFGEEDRFGNERSAFDHAIATIEGSLRPLFREFRRLDFATTSLQGTDVVVDRVAQRLGESLYGTFGAIAADPDEPIFLSHLLAGPIALRPDLQLGGRYVNVIGVTGYPQLLYPAIADHLRYLPFEFRYVVRIQPYAVPQALDAFRKVSRQHLLSSLGLGLLINRNSGGEMEETPLAWRQQLREARNSVQAGEMYGSVLPQVVVYGESPEERDNATEALRVSLERTFLRPKIETAMNRFLAYLSTLPAECDANELRYARSTLRGAVRLSAITGTWHGPERHPDARFKDERVPLIMMSTRAREPFRLVLHVGQVGHTLVIGRTGRGKSVLLRALENAHLARYRGARVLSFDILLSAYKYARAINGRHYTLEMGSGPQIAPLTGLDDPEQFEPILEWLTVFAELWLGRAMAVGEHDDLRLGLKSVQGIPLHDGGGRRLSDLGKLLQIPELKIVFDQLRDSFLDAVEDHFSFADPIVPYWCFEMGKLGVDNVRWNLPTVLYLQRRAFAEFAAGDRLPTLVTMDEGARALKIAKMQDFAERIDREGRKNRVQFIFATQGVGEILESKIRNVLIEQTPTKIAMANRDAGGTELRKGYLEIGFTEDDVETIVAMGEFDILVRSEYGVQVVQLNPSEVELLIFGGASQDDCNTVDALIDQYGQEEWLPQYLLQAGGPHLNEHVNELRNLITRPAGSSLTALEAPSS